MYRSWVWCAECSSLDVCGTLWTNLLPRTKNKATIEVFAGQPNEESDWETTTYCPSTRLVSRSSFIVPRGAAHKTPFAGFCVVGRQEGLSWLRLSGAVVAGQLAEW